MPYTAVTFAQVKAQLQERLSDTAVFWPDQELGLHVQDAMRLWNILTGENRVNFALPIVAANPVWYDLNLIAGSPRLATLTDRDVYLRITYALLESPSNTAVVVSSQYSSDEIIQSVQRKRDEFMLRTGCTSSIETLAGGPTIQLPERVIQARRAYWLPNAIPGTTPQPSPLFRSDLFAVSAYAPQAQGNPGQPVVFSSGTEPPLTVDIIPPPAVPGRVEFITIESQAPLTQAQATVLLIPDDFVGAVSWGALADLMSSGMTAEDPTRAAIAKQRYDELTVLMDQYPFILSAQVGGSRVFVDAVENLDTYSPQWRTSTANPSVVATSGKNLVAFPTNRDMNIVLFMVGNANLPAVNGDIVQLGDETLDAILDEAQSTAAFKMGGAEAQSSHDLHGNIIRLAAKKNARIEAMSIFKETLYGRAGRGDLASPQEVTYDQA